MSIPHILPLGFIHQLTLDGAIIMLTNPRDSLSLRSGTPVTLWRYSQGLLALAKIRGRISAVGYVTATFTTVETQKDIRWPENLEVLRPKAPVYLALPDSFEPDTSRMLSQEEAEGMSGLAARYRHITKPKQPQTDGHSGPPGNGARPTV